MGMPRQIVDPEAGIGGAASQQVPTKGVSASVRKKKLAEGMDIAALDRSLRESWDRFVAVNGEGMRAAFEEFIKPKK